MFLCWPDDLVDRRVADIREETSLADGHVWRSAGTCRLVEFLWAKESIIFWPTRGVCNLLVMDAVLAYLACKMHYQ